MRLQVPTQSAIRFGMSRIDRRILNVQAEHAEVVAEVELVQT